MKGFKWLLLNSQIYINRSVSSKAGDFFLSFLLEVDLLAILNVCR